MYQITPEKHGEQYFTTAKHREKDSMVDVENQLLLLKDDAIREPTFSQERESTMKSKEVNLIDDSNGVETRNGE